MAAQKATDIRRALAEVENNARDLREQQGRARKGPSIDSGNLLGGGGREGALCAEFCAAGLGPADTHHRDLVAAVENVTLAILGRAKRVMIDKENTTIVSGAGKKADIEARVNKIEA